MPPGPIYGEVRLQGSVVARLPSGAIVQANGRPSQPIQGVVQGVIGLVYVHEHNMLNATTRDTPISGRVIPAGTYEYTDSQGVVHVLAAWRL